MTGSSGSCSPSITEDLKQAVEYLNVYTVDGTTAVVLELDYSKVGDVEILVPLSFGEEAAQRKRASRAARLDRGRSVEVLTADATPRDVEVARRLYDWAGPARASLLLG